MRSVIRTVRTLLVVVLLGMAACGTPAADPGLLVEDGISYAPDADLTVYRPAGVAAAPVVVLLHGCCGDRADMGQLARALAAEGVLVFNTGWTPASRGGGWPRSYAEAGCAVAWARAQAGALGGDPGRVVLVAWSDAALLGSVAAFGAAPSLPGCQATAAARPDAFVALGGFFGHGLPELQDLTPLQARFLGVTDGRAPGLPASYVGSAASSPTWLVTGEDDDLMGQAVAWEQTLGAAGVSVSGTYLHGSHVDVISPRTPLGATAVEVVLAAAAELMHE